MSTLRSKCVQILLATCVLCTVAVPAALPQDLESIGYGAPSSSPKPSEQLKSVCEIELKLEAVLELLPLALPGQNLEKERQVLIDFFDRISATVDGGKATAMMGYEASGKSTTDLNNTDVPDLERRIQKLERIQAQRQKNIERRIELLKLRIQHAEIVRDRNRTAESREDSTSP